MKANSCTLSPSFPLCFSGLKISVKVLSLSFQAGLVGGWLFLLFMLLHIYIFWLNILQAWLLVLCIVHRILSPFCILSDLDLFLVLEPFYGTICLYNRDRREKLSEDFYFHMLPTESQDVRESFSHSFSVVIDTISQMFSMGAMTNLYLLPLSG